MFSPFSIALFMLLAFLAFMAIWSALDWLKVNVEIKDLEGDTPVQEGDRVIRIFEMSDRK